MSKRYTELSAGIKTCLLSDMTSCITHQCQCQRGIQSSANIVLRPSINRRVKMNIRYGITFLFFDSLVCNKFEKCGSLRSDSTSNLFAFQGSTEEEDIMAPWLAAVGKYTQEVFKDFQVSCSGVIVSREIIVTAAHCFVAYIEANKTELIPTHVRVGANRIDSRFSEDRKIKEYIVHPNYMFPAFYFDIALILLEEDLIFSSRISPICLPETSQSHPGANSAIRL